jgi:hypothetical protein
MVRYGCCRLYEGRSVTLPKWLICAYFISSIIRHPYPIDSPKQR